MSATETEKPSGAAAPRSSGWLSPLGYRMQRVGRAFSRRIRRKPRTVAESPNLLPVLIKVLAGFSKTAGGEAVEEEIDSSLGFLRYDYPEAVYSELRGLFRQALQEQQDLSAMAQRLSSELSPDRKILLCVQLYDLIAKSGMRQDQVVAYYSFMAQLGMAAQAIDIVYQLNAAESPDTSVYQEGASPLESLRIASDGTGEVTLRGIEAGGTLFAYRNHDLILFKNFSQQAVTVRGRLLGRGEFCRIYPGARIVVGEQVLTYQDLAFYFNAKKNVSLPHVFLKVNADDEVELERSRSRESCLEVRFGLKVQVTALRNTDAELNGLMLRAGTSVEGSLEDRILFHGDSELPLADLRRRARAMGGRFPLKVSKSEYLVSNDPALLEEDDILLSPGTSGEVLLKIFCDYERKVGTLDVLKADRPILIGDTPVRNSAPLADGDIIRVDQGQELVCDFTERLIEERRNIIRHLEVVDLALEFRTADPALDGISFSASRGELVCVMGASGSGKSTLLKVIAGSLRPRRGQVLLNGHSLYHDPEHLSNYVSLVPQDDAFDEHLTIGENLDFAAALRAPHLSRSDRMRRVEGKLIELGLGERRDTVVGSAVKKTLSGGERKRLNIGLDMIGSADVYLFDEPTSGLSSKDSEHVVEILRGLSHNKIVLVTIHQPSSKLFQMFHKAMLLDKGGRLVFFGTPSEMLAYFAEAEHEQQFGTELGGCPACGTTRPEFIFDVLETPLRDLSGDIIYEENSRGQLVPARRFSALYWRDRYEAHRLMQEVKQVPMRRDSEAPITPVTPATRRPSVRWRDEWVQLRTLLRRAFQSKLRNRANLLTTMVEAPVLAALIAMVLRYSEGRAYDFASAYHIPTYLFLALIVAMFLGLTNSADDIIRDRAVLQRERNVGVRLPYYIFSKVVTLALFAVVQCFLFLLIGNAILEIRGMFWIHLFHVSATALAGVAIGLVISALAPDAKTAANVVPLVLIPQIILGGALIKYEEMNRDLDLAYTFRRFFAQQGQTAERPSDLAVPFFCEFIPMRWSYESLVVAQARLNPLTRRQETVQGLIEATILRLDTDPAAAEPLDNLKETLSAISGLESETAGDIDRRLRRADQVIRNPLESPGRIASAKRGVTADRLYVNQKIADLVAKSEMEQTDYREQAPINVFFGRTRRVGSTDMSVFVFNGAVLLAFILAMLGLLHGVLLRQLRTRGPSQPAD